MHFSRLIGYASILGYCLVSAYYCVAIHNKTQAINPNLLAFLIFFICLLFFSGMNFFKLGTIFNKIKKQPYNLLAVNISTAINWITTIWSLKYITPVAFIIIFMTSLPIFNFILQQFIKRSFNKIELTLVSLLFLAMLAFIHLSLSINHGALFGEGILLCLTSSLSGAIYLIFSHRLQQLANLTASQLVTVRFYLLIILTAFFATNTIPLNQLIPTLGQINFPEIIVLALLTTALPLYLLQKGVSELGASKIAYFIPMTIVFTYLIEVYFRTAILDLPHVIIILILLGLITGLNRIKHH